MNFSRLMKERKKKMNKTEFIEAVAKTAKLSKAAAADAVNAALEVIAKALKKGDAVETSGYSNSFPEGIFVGRILKVRNSSDGLSYEPVIALSADLANVRNVSVILGKK